MTPFSSPLNASIRFAASGSSSNLPAAPHETLRRQALAATSGDTLLINAGNANQANQLPIRQGHAIWDTLKTWGTVGLMTPLVIFGLAHPYVMQHYAQTLPLEMRRDDFYQRAQQVQQEAQRFVSLQNQGNQSTYGQARLLDRSLAQLAETMERYGTETLPESDQQAVRQTQRQRPAMVQFNHEQAAALGTDFSRFFLETLAAEGLHPDTVTREQLQQTFLEGGSPAANRFYAQTADATLRGLNETQQQRLTEQLLDGYVQIRQDYQRTGIRQGFEAYADDFFTGAFQAGLYPPLYGIQPEQLAHLDHRQAALKFVDQLEAQGEKNYPTLSPEQRQAYFNQTRAVINSVDDTKMHALWETAQNVLPLVGTLTPAALLLLLALGGNLNVSKANRLIEEGKQKPVLVLERSTPYNTLASQVAFTAQEMSRLAEQFNQPLTSTEAIAYFAEQTRQQLLIKSQYGRENLTERDFAQTLADTMRQSFTNGEFARRIGVDTERVNAQISPDNENQVALESYFTLFDDMVKLELMGQAQKQQQDTYLNEFERAGRELKDLLIQQKAKLEQANSVLTAYQANNTNTTLQDRVQAVSLELADIQQRRTAAEQRRDGFRERALQTQGIEQAARESLEAIRRRQETLMIQLNQIRATNLQLSLQQSMDSLNELFLDAQQRVDEQEALLALNELSTQTQQGYERYQKATQAL
ncbi:MAG: hypothetical protein SFZ03_05085 [Candidatus Melainabacteria bacterium]|nr:hypothetical protein [Candidatus Melainabacteria bacterium]